MNVIQCALAKLGLEWDDYRFFIPFGVAAAVLMELAAQLPVRYNRGVISAMIFDHIPWYSITVLLLFQVVVLCFYHQGPSTYQKYARQLAFVMCRRICSLSSGASAVLFGMAAGCLLIHIPVSAWAHFHGTHSPYIRHMAAFAMFACIFVGLAVMSRLHISTIRHFKARLWRDLLFIVGASIFAALTLSIVFNDRPIKLQIELPIKAYDAAAKRAKESGVDTERMIESMVLREFQE